MSRHDPPQVFLVDGHALIYRAFFALISRPLRTSRGENTSAAWGVVNFLLRLQTKYQPEYVVWILDKGDSFRRAAYPAYKSTREKLDAELQQDFDLALEQVREILEAFRIPIVTVEGFEADDVIGTLAQREAAAGRQTVIVSGDKDFYQLIGPRVALLNPGRGGPAGVEETWVDERNASDRLGVPPGQVIDYLALVGDSSDNVPGVKGVGEKTAIQLLGQYGSLDAILEHAGDVKAKRPREALLAEADQARLSRMLVTIKTDVPVVLDIAAAESQAPDQDRLRRILTRLEFHSLVNRLSSAEPVTEEAAPAAPTARTVAVDVVTSAADLTAAVRALRAGRIMALRVEGSSSEAHDAELVGLTLADRPDHAWYLPFGHRSPEGLLLESTPVQNLPALGDCPELAALLSDASVAKAGHDLKLGWQMLRRAGIELAGVQFDTMLASFVLDPGRRSHALDTLCLDHLGRLPAPPPGSGKNEPPLAERPAGEVAERSGAEAAAVLALEEFFVPRLEETALAPLLADIEMPLVRVLVEMEWTGIAIDRTVFD
ncbi:MAG: 5'-3' exonuclease H3TH domain-containing protein, partial [Gemmatimonadales bacterium]